MAAKFISTQGVLVTHLFKGSWKEDHPLGEEHDYEAEKQEEEDKDQANIVVKQP